MGKRGYLFLCLAPGLSNCSTTAPAPAPTPVAAFTLSREVVGQGEPLQATNTSQYAANYRWQAPGMVDSVQTAANPTFTAGVVGTQTIRLTAYTTDVHYARTTRTVQVGQRIVSTLRVTAVPATRPTGQPWHADGTGLNLSCELYSAPSILSVKQFEGDVVPNVQAASLPLSWTPGARYVAQSSTVFFYDNVGGRKTYLTSLTVLSAGPPVNQDQAGNGSYTTQLNGWTVVFETAIR